MPTVDQTLRGVLKQLTADRVKIDHQIGVIRSALDGNSARPGARPGRRPGRRKVSAAERAATSKRMKAYWAKRKKAKTKS